MGQPDQGQRRLGALLELGAVFGLAEHALHGQVYVLVAGQPGQKRMVLEHHGALGRGTLDLAVGAQQHARARRGEAGNQVEQRRLAAARVPDQRDEIALGDTQVDVVERQELALGGLEALRDALQLDESVVHDFTSS
jgi:hypothetical protein